MTPAQLRQVDAYLDTLMDWNQRMNLTAIRNREEAYERHIQDSLALLPVIDAHMADGGADAGDKGRDHDPPPGPLHVIDVGSGAGLPGVVLAIARPDWRVTLLDSMAKRTHFLEAALAAAGVGNARVVCSSAEAAGRDGSLRGTFQLALARAVAETRVLAELCLPLVAQGGLLVAAKGPTPEAEVAAALPAIAELGGCMEALHSVHSMAGTGLPRTALVIRKVGPTPDKYPRLPGRPAKRPL